jgi:hypothetical protein
VKRKKQNKDNRILGIYEQDMIKRKKQKEDDRILGIYEQDMFDYDSTPILIKKVVGMEAADKFIHDYAEKNNIKPNGLIKIYAKFIVD